MAAKITVSKVDIRTSKELEKECKQYLKDAIAEVLADCQETKSLAQDELTTQKNLLKKTKDTLKELQNKLKKAEDALAKKETKATQNRVKSLVAQQKTVLKSVALVEKNIMILQSEINGIKAYQLKQKAFRQNFNQFDKTYAATVTASQPEAAKVKAVTSNKNNVTAELKKEPTISLLKEGMKAPEFTVKNEAGEDVSLTSFLGKKVVLYFYPKDDTPGCTAQANDFTAQCAWFNDHNTVVLGVSRDNEASHQRFKAKYNINFPLLSDENEKICQDYGVIKMKNLYGKAVRGIERTTFVIDEKGIIAKVWRKVKVAGHANEVLCFAKDGELSLT